MPSVFTIEGHKKKRGKKRKTKRKGLGMTGCKYVKMGKSGCEIQLCMVRGRAKFQRGTKRCPR